MHRAYGGVPDSQRLVGGVLEAGEAMRHTHYAPPPPGDPTLFEQEAPSVPIDTSEAAAQHIAPHTMRLRSAVYAYLVTCGPRGATLREICQALGISENTGRPRCWELCGHAPAGRPPRRALIRMTDERRAHMRVYVVI